MSNRIRNRKRDIEYSKKWRNEHRDHYHKIQKVARDKKRLAVLLHYSHGKLECNCCGERHIQFLALDHIGGGGNKHRKEVGYGDQFFRWLIRNGFPDGYQVLCHNCNLSIALYGVCPHKII